MFFLSDKFIQTMTDNVKMVSEDSKILLTQVQKRSEGKEEPQNKISMKSRPS